MTPAPTSEETRDPLPAKDYIRRHMIAQQASSRITSTIDERRGRRRSGEVCQMQPEGAQRWGINKMILLYYNNILSWLMIVAEDRRLQTASSLDACHSLVEHRCARLTSSLIQHLTPMLYASYFRCCYVLLSSTTQYIIYRLYSVGVSQVLHGLFELHRAQGTARSSSVPRTNTERNDWRATSPPGEAVQNRSKGSVPRAWICLHGWYRDYF